MPLKRSLVEKPNDLSSYVLPSRFFMIHDSSGGCENYVTKLTGGQELDNPLLEICEADVIARRDDTSLVKAIREVSQNFIWSARYIHTGRSIE